MDATGREITHLLNQAAAGDTAAAREAFAAIYAELRRLASARAARHPAAGTLQTTALVHEAYLRIVGRHPDGWQNARHFYFTAARAMRDLLVEDARRKASRKRGGGQERVTFDDLVAAPERGPDALLALDAALADLEGEDPVGHRLVMLRFFAGLPMPEVAGALEVSLSTANRKWRFLRAWLTDRIGDPEA
jgi:RNA polymerase sigma factor (TIGR02999 family)